MYKSNPSASINNNFVFSLVIAVKQDMHSGPYKCDSTPIAVPTFASLKSVPFSVRRPAALSLFYSSGVSSATRADFL